MESPDLPPSTPTKGTPEKPLSVALFWTAMIVVVFLLWLWFSR